MPNEFFEVVFNILLLLLTLYIGFKIGKKLSQKTVVQAPTPTPDVPYVEEAPTPKPKAPAQSRTPSEIANAVYQRQFEEVSINFEKDILAAMQRGEYSFNSFSALYNRLPKEATFKALQVAAKKFHAANPTLKLDATFDRHHNRGQYVQCKILLKD